MPVAKPLKNPRPEKSEFAAAFTSYSQETIHKMHPVVQILQAQRPLITCSCQLWAVGGKYSKQRPVEALMPHKPCFACATPKEECCICLPQRQEHKERHIIDSTFLNMPIQIMAAFYFVIFSFLKKTPTNLCQK